MQEAVSGQVFAQGLEFLRRNRLVEASNAFRRAFKEDPDNPWHLSYYGLVLALTGENIQDGINFCRAAIHRAYKPEFYVNLCRVYANVGQRKKALETLLEGLGFDRNNALMRMEMKRMGVRRKPLLRFLPRDHVLNRRLGKFTYELRRSRIQKTSFLPWGQ